MYVLPLLFLIATLIARYFESGWAREYVAELRRVWKDLGVPGRIVIGIVVAMCTLTGGSKGKPSPAAAIFTTHHLSSILTQERTPR